MIDRVETFLEIYEHIQTKRSISLVEGMVYILCQGQNGILSRSTLSETKLIRRENITRRGMGI